MMPNGQPPKIGGQLPNIGDREAQAKVLVAQQLAHLSMAIYSQAVSQHFETADHTRFQATARKAHQAARAYFESLGLAQFSEASQ